MEEHIQIMKEFPDFNAAGFDMETYNRRFREGNVIIHARSTDVAYPSHWGCLSIKCALKGREYYEANNTAYAVDDNGFLILNEGQVYSSYIYSEEPVESFTINFSALFTQTLLDSLAVPTLEFIERLYPHDNSISPILSALYRQSLAKKPDTAIIMEQYFLLLEEMVLLQAHIEKEIQKVKAVKTATRKELYRRLHNARDYMDAFYMNPVTLSELAGVACLNPAYFLRQWKRYFGRTPHRYLMEKRVSVAAKLLATTRHSVTEICYSVGYEDLTSFIKLFRKHYQLTPEKYQLQHQKKSIFTC
ncbi:MAG TPA: AraC family transcriptional regulator [Puia sp.]|nr:AraC family transcriptional regulator [Puia sp.]